MRSNTTVGPPIDVALCAANELRITRYRRFGADDPDLRAIRVQWEQALRKSVQELPAVRFDDVKL
jgi:putative proteasome-type protease